jgi:hypothetical protein
VDVKIRRSARGRGFTGGFRLWRFHVETIIDYPWGRNKKTREAGVRVGGG